MLDVATVGSPLWSQSRVSRCSLEGGEIPPNVLWWKGAVSFDSYGTYYQIAIIHTDHPLLCLQLRSHDFACILVVQDAGSSLPVLLNLQNHSSALLARHMHSERVGEGFLACFEDLADGNPQGIVGNCGISLTEQVPVYSESERCGIPASRRSNDFHSERPGRHVQIISDLNQSGVAEDQYRRTDQPFVKLLSHMQRTCMT